MNILFSKFLKKDIFFYKMDMKTQNSKPALGLEQKTKHNAALGPRLSKPMCQWRLMQPFCTLSLQCYK